MITLTPRSTLFPYTTLFRSRVVRQLGRFGGRRRASGLPCHALDVCFTPMADNAALAKLTLARLSLSAPTRSEEHTSELQSLRHIVCRLLLEKKKVKK